MSDIDHAANLETLAGTLRVTADDFAMLWAAAEHIRQQAESLTYYQARLAQSITHRHATLDRICGALGLPGDAGELAAVGEIEKFREGYEAFDRNDMDEY